MQVAESETLLPRCTMVLLAMRPTPSLRCGSQHSERDAANRSTKSDAPSYWSQAAIS
jgi:hypothetical protein